jgi:hypothetical protein
MLPSGRASAPKCVFAHFLLEAHVTPRQARRERREAERKARRAELKRAKAATAELGFVSQNSIASPTHNREQSDGLHSRFLSQNAAMPVTEPRFVSQSRAEINRQNAQHSTGPRSAEGKLASSRNSLKHGLASGTLLIPGEDAAEFEALRNALIEEHQPASETEELLINDMAQSYWLTQRAIRLQNECFTFEGVDPKQLSLFLRYQTTHERAFYKALNTLLRLKQSRAREQAVSRSGFVSQSANASTSPTRSPGQTDGARLDEAARLSEPKTPVNGFVSQTAPETPPNPLAHTLAA